MLSFYGIGAFLQRILCFDIKTEQLSGDGINYIPFTKLPPDFPLVDNKSLLIN